MHLGLGAFARAHLAVYTDEVLAQGALAWGICGVSLRSPAVRDALAPQAGLYSLYEHGSAAPRVIGSVVRCLVEPEEPGTVRRVLRDPAVRIVSLTVTESGYSSDAPATRLIAAALAARHDAGDPPFTVLCLDNIAGTGATLRAQVLACAGSVDAGLTAWIEERVAFPRSMVDRMVPRTTERDRRRVREALGVEDAWPVACEPFRQWILEDDFPTGRPPWELAGATFVQDAAAWEALKLRVLNAGHLALACLGLLAGHGRISQAASDAGLRDFVERLLREEVGAVLTAPNGIDLGDYVSSILRRFSNDALGYRTSQTASDGSLKLRARLLPSIVSLEGERADRLALVVAAWIRIVTGPLSERISDPNLARIQATAAGSADPREVASRVLALTDLFGEIRASGRFAERVGELAALLAERGVAAALRRVASRRI